MSALALEIDQTLQRLDAATAFQFEKLLRDALALVKSKDTEGAAQSTTSIRFPLVQGARTLTGEDVARLEAE